ncbi:MAG: MATE family efflux transporter [Spirochaetia bacterium]|nr:MATE family efflux transporter [Spirochaetia bacterium]
MENKVMDLTKGSIYKHIMTMAVPASIGYFFNTMYNFTDTFWAGRASTAALAALSLAFPIFIVVLAFGSGIGSGVTGIISNLFGKGEKDKVKEYFIQSVILGLFFSIITAIIMYIFMNPIFSLFHAEGELLRYAGEYTSIIIFGSPFFILNYIINGLLVAAGDTKSFSKFLITGFFINIVLDPLLMFGLTIRGVSLFPGMGIPGIALATVLVQIGGVLYLSGCVKKLDILKAVGKDSFTPKLSQMKEIIEQAAPATLNMIIMAAGVFVITYYISRFGESAIAAYGAAIRIEQIALIPTIGLNTALSSITGQNNGAGNVQRIRDAFLKTLMMGAVLFLLVMVPVVIFARPILTIFTTDTEVLRIGSLYLGIQLVAFYSYILLFQSGSVLQGMKKPGMILWSGIYRQVPAPLIFFNLFAYTFGLGIAGIWWGIVAVNWTAALVILFATMKLMSSKKSLTLQEEMG